LDGFTAVKRKYKNESVMAFFIILKFKLRKLKILLNESIDSGEDRE
jgi:hypothetical protein